MVVATMYSNLLSGGIHLPKYLASWYDAVPMLDIIKHIGRLPIVPVDVSIFFLVR